MKSLSLKSIFTLVIGGLFFTGSVVSAQSGMVEKELSVDQIEVLSAYERVNFVSLPEMVIPTVVSVPFGSAFHENSSLLVLENETGRFIGSKLVQTNEFVDPVTRVETVPSLSARNSLIDNDLSTTAQFDLSNESSSLAVITLSGSSNQLITASTLNVSLAQNVSLPAFVSVRAMVDGEMKTIVAKRGMNSPVVRFPETAASFWVVEFTYTQPLRIAELAIGPAQILSDVSTELRFLAQPGLTYKIYSVTDRTVSVNTTESGSLSNTQQFLSGQVTEIIENPLYKPADVDGDGVRDTLDNCVRYPNPDQKDVNRNGKGDDCEDFDGDGVMNPSDNCPDIPNRYQRDEDSDGIGDECDEEESRLTERHTWVPWVGMGLAVVVIMILFALVGIKPEEETPEESNDEQEGQ